VLDEKTTIYLKDELNLGEIHPIGAKKYQGADINTGRSSL
jgi:hypothetical protein